MIYLATETTFGWPGSLICDDEEWLLARPHVSELPGSQDVKLGSVVSAPSERQGLGRTPTSVVPALEKQWLVAHGNEHRGWHSHGLDAGPDGVTSLVGVMAGDAALGMHMFSSVCEHTRSMAARAGARDW